MAPEYATGETIGPASDRYSLAVIVYELLTGRVPYTADTPLAVLLAQASKPLPSPRSINPAISPAVEGVLLTALAREPDNRYPTASAFIAALVEAGREESPAPAPEPEPVVPVPAPEVAAKPLNIAETGAPPRKPVRKSGGSRPSARGGSRVRTRAAHQLLDAVSGLYTRVAWFLSKRGAGLRTGRSRSLAAGALLIAAVLIAGIVALLSHAGGRQVAAPPGVAQSPAVPATVAPAANPAKAPATHAVVAPATASPGRTPSHITGANAGPAPLTLASTVPVNGDVNPYGIAVVRKSSGRLVQGAVLVSNFNNKKNLAGTGTTIVQITPDGKSQLFARVDPAHLPGPCPGGVGLTSAIAVVQRYVFVGSLPTNDGTPATARAGCLLVLNDAGQVISTIASPNINGPWAMTAYDGGPIVSLFVANVLNGTVAAGMDGTNQGTVVRLNLKISDQGPPQVLATTVIGSGFRERAAPTALVLGPTGLALAPNGTLYICDTLGNRIAAIPHAVKHASNAHTGEDVAAAGSLNEPLGLVFLPNGDFLTVNGGDGRMVRIKPSGAERGARFLDQAGSPPGAGALFGLAVTPDGKGVYFVDDKSSKLLHVNVGAP